MVAWERGCARGTSHPHPTPPHTTHAGVKLSVFDGAKKVVTTAERAYDEECVRVGLAPPVREELQLGGRKRAAAA